MRHWLRHRFWCLVPVGIVIFLSYSHGSLLAEGVYLSWSPSPAADLAGYKIYYGTASRSYTTSINIGNQTAYTVSGLKADTYYFAVTAYDSSRNESTFSNEASATISSSPPSDTTPPQIFSVGTTLITTNSAKVSWATNEASDSQVEYGKTSAYGSSTGLVSTKVASHSVSLSGLLPSTTYHYHVKSRDAAGNLATSTDLTFATAGDTTAPTISAVGASSITASGAAIHWTTSEVGDTQVEYGTTAAYGNSSPLVSALVTSHSVSLSGLQASKLYHYRVKSRDAANNLAISSDFTFTTSAVSPGPMISSVGAASITANSASVHWTTDKVSDTQVDYGTTTAYGSSTARVSTMVTKHIVLLSGLQTSRVYHYRVKSRDSSGNMATSSDFAFTTSKDATPPVISGVRADSISDSGATIHWTTNEASDTQVEYGLTSVYGRSTSLNASRVTTHNQVLGGLAADTLYHYRIKSRDAAGSLAVSGDFKFNTAGTDATKTVISRVGASWITATGTTINWTSNEPCNGQVEFGMSTTYGDSTSRVSSLAMSHGVKLSGLKASTRYHYRIKSRDAAGNLVTSGDNTFTTSAPDNTPPVISNVAVSFITGTQATISWTTNEASNSQVKYGLTSAYGSQSNLNASLMMKHSQVLLGLSRGSVYHYRVKSRDASGNLATSVHFTFRTAKSDITPPTIITFDSPAPQGTSNDLLNGVLGGIDFGSSRWRWEGPYGVNTTKHIYFDSASGNSRTFNFSPAPKILNSITVFSVSPGTLTLADNLGQRKAQSVPAGSMQLVTTGWTKGSTTITINFSQGWSLGVDDITFSPVDTAAALSSAPADNSDFVISGIAGLVPDVAGQPANPSPEALFVSSIVEDSRFRTNLGISNLSASIANVKLSLVDQQGDILASRVVSVNPLELEQINSVARVLLPEGPRSAIQGSLILESEQEIRAWVAQIDNSSNDPSFLQGRGQGSTRILIPSAANLTSLRSSLTLMNIGSISAQVSLRAYDLNGAIIGQTHVPISLSPRGSIAFENVLEALGVTDNFGPVEITSINEVPLLATSRVSSASQSGGFFEGLDYSDASTLLVIPSVVESADQRTNIGINNVSDRSASVLVRLRSRDGSELGTAQVAVPAKGLTQLNHAVRKLTGGVTTVDSEGYVELQSDQPILAWASGIDNKTNDPGFDTARSVGSSRLLFRSTNLGNFKSSLVVVNENDTEAIVDIVSRNERGEVQGQLRSLSIPAKGYFSSANILEGLGMSQGSGTIEIISTNDQPIFATSRVYTNSRTSGFLGGQQLK